jgi:hypothetical protein
MHIRNLSIVTMMTVTVLGSSSLLAQEHAEVPAYQYGTHLDVAKVIRIDEPSPPTCETVRAKMTFLNTRGVTEQVSFLKQAQACLRD